MGHCIRSIRMKMKKITKAAIKFHIILGVCIFLSFALTACTSDRGNAAAKLSVVKKLDPSGKVTGQFFYAWEAFGAGYPWRDANGQFYLDYDLAGLEAYLDIINESDNPWIFKTQTSLWTNDSVEPMNSPDFYLDSKQKNKHSYPEKIVVPPKSKKRIFFTEFTERYKTVMAGSPQFRLTDLDVAFPLQKPGDHDIFFKKIGCSHLCQAQLLNSKWVGHQYNGYDLVSLEVTLEFTNRASSKVFIREPISLVTENSNELTTFTPGSSEIKPDLNWTATGLDGGKSMTMHFMAKAVPYSVAIQAGQLYVANKHSDWKFPVSSVPSYEVLFAQHSNKK